MRISDWSSDVCSSDLILSTLASGQFVVKDSQRATYRLGPKLVEIGTASRRNFSRRSFYRRQVRPLVDKIGVGCIVAQPLGDFSGIVVIDRILPALPPHEVVEIGRASCREGVCPYV